MMLMIQKSISGYHHNNLIYSNYCSKIDQFNISSGDLNSSEIEFIEECAK